MKKIITAILLILVTLPVSTAFAEKPVGRNIRIIISGGTYHPETGRYTYGYVAYREQNGEITIICRGEGSKECPAQVSIFVTVITGGLVHSSFEQDMEIIKGKIAGGEKEGKVSIGDMLYSWKDGILHEESGVFEFDLQGELYENIKP